uniref:ZZ-type domain-containing protein n=1 Tax=Percolomonas cosmopolitus TaxID=63605 RepID=A0A7S1KTT7_9EUKA|mmetsp:Transcript_8103/g.30061  ORF Transcript_8103/g.30061 Transcript_8103/m.30061 type:complete len:338 (+) Transcript_8103:1106-2119(+)
MNPFAAIQRTPGSVNAPSTSRRFKITLNNPDGVNKHSIRRFTLTQPTYEALVSALQSDSTLDSTLDTLNITYLDEDSDTVSVCSQMEMEEMLLELGNVELVKLEVHVVRRSQANTSTHEPSTTPATPQPQPQTVASQDTVHSAHGCDICRTIPIKGHRFHCLSCKDYDVCATCFTAHIKSKHPIGHKFEVIGHVKGETLGGDFQIQEPPKMAHVPIVEKIICDACAEELPRASDNKTHYQSTDKKHHLCPRCYPHRSLLGISANVIFNKQQTPPSYAESTSPDTTPLNDFSKSKYKDQLKILESMHLLKDMAAAEKVLESFGGNLPKTVNTLLGDNK